MAKRKIIIAGAAGRDFHNFNVLYRNDPDVEVVAFTATQIPDIDGRKYPAELAGPNYPDGIPIEDEEIIADLIRDHAVDDVVFSYSDVSYAHVGQLGAICRVAGARFITLNPYETMIQSSKPVVAICAMRTGCGKSQTTRRVCQILEGMGLKAVPIRHPMPYGDLVKQTWQRFETEADLDEQDCTIEEREEYGPHIEEGRVVFAGVDYQTILDEAEKEADVIIWDGGNNDTSFYTPDLLIVVGDPLRHGHERQFYPGEDNMRMAHVVVINKMDTASGDQIAKLMASVRKLNADATIVQAASPVTVDDPSVIAGKNVLVIEDGPTCTHGHMTIGAGFVAAQRVGVKGFADARHYAVGEIGDTYAKYPNIGREILPAMGYGEQQVADLYATIVEMHKAGEIEAVVIGTPYDITAMTGELPVPHTRVRYGLDEIASPNLTEILTAFKEEHVS